MSGTEAYQTLYKRVRRAHFRHHTLALLNAFLQALFYAMLTAGLVAGLLSLTPWAAQRTLTALVLLTLTLPATAVLYFWRRHSLQTTALLADRHLRLKEKITSALELGQIRAESEQEHEWHHALLMDALHEVNRIDLKKAFPWVNPPEAKWFWAPALILALTVFVLPQWDLLTGQGTAQAKPLEAKQVEKNLESLVQRQLVLERRAKEEDNQKAGELAKEIKELSDSLSKGKLEKRDALAQLSTLEKKWSERQEQLEKGLPKQEKPLSPNQSRLTQELAKAMQEGDFKKAAEALQALQQQLKTDGMTAEDQKDLSKELKELSEKLGEDNTLAKELENASDLLDKGNMDLAMKALNLAELDAESLKDLLEQMKLIDGAMKELMIAKAKLAGICPKCGKKLGNKPGQCDGSCICSECGSGNCNGRCSILSRFGKFGTGGFREGNTDNPSNGGMNGPGQGRGGRAPFSETDTQYQTDIVQSPMNEAPMQGAVPFKGDSSLSQSNLQIQGTVIQAQQAAEDALSKEKIPVTLKSQVRSYFNSLDSADASSGKSGE